MRGPVDDVGVVGGGDDRTAGLPVGRDEPDDGRPGAAVLADGRLVGEQHRWAVVQGRGHGEAALFASRELARVGCLEVGQAEGCEQGAGPVGRGGADVVGVAVLSASPLPGACPRVRAVVSTSSSTVRATIVELDHCGTQARVRARSGAESEAGGTPSGASGARPGRGGRGSAVAAIGGRTCTAPGSVGARNPARACSTVDLPDPLGPTSAVSVPGRGDEGVGEHGGPAGAGGAVDEPGGALDDERNREDPSQTRHC